MSFLTSNSVESTIPYSGLSHRYIAADISASDGDAISSWPDAKGSADLSATGNPTYQSDGIDNGPSVDTDGNNNFLSTTFTDTSEPYEIFVVAEALNPTRLGQCAVDGARKNEARFEADLSPVWALYQGSHKRTGSSPDGNAHLFDLIWRASSNSDEMLLDGSQDISGDSGNAVLTGITLGARGDGSVRGNYRFAEVIIYNEEKTANERSDVESYTSSEYGLTI